MKRRSWTGSSLTFSQRAIVRSSALAACVVASAFAGFARADDGRVRRGETLAEARPSAPAPLSSAAAKPSPQWLAVRSGAALVLLGCAGGAFIVVRRRRRADVPLADVPIRIVARKAVSPRHTILVVEVDGERMVLGMSGDRMTTLAVAAPRGTLSDEGTALASSADREPGTQAGAFSGEDQRAPVARGEGVHDVESLALLPGETALTRRLRESRENGSRQLEPLFSREEGFGERSRLLPEELEPYRRSVHRLKRLLHDDVGTSSPDDEPMRGATE